MTVLRGHTTSDRCFDVADRPHPVRRSSVRPWAVAERDPTDGRLALLARTIEGEIIPRLMLAHRAEPHRLPQSARRAATSSDEIADFAGLLLGTDCAVALTSIDVLRADGVALESVFLDLLAPAARHLGELWKADLCDFTDVTVGLSHLHQIVRTLSPAFESEADVTEPGARALIAAMPGEQHAFGAVIVEEFMRRAGWEVVHAVHLTAAELIRQVADEWFEVAGLSLSCEGLLDPLPSLIRSLRQASLNPELWVMVGGRPFVDDPDLALRVGADATAADGRHAVRQTQHLLQPRLARAKA